MRGQASCCPGVPHPAGPLNLPQPHPPPPDNIALLPVGAGLRLGWFALPHVVFSTILQVRCLLFIEMKLRPSKSRSPGNEQQNQHEHIGLHNSKTYLLSILLPLFPPAIFTINFFFRPCIPKNIVICSRQGQPEQDADSNKPCPLPSPDARFSYQENQIPHPELPPSDHAALALSSSPGQLRWQSTVWR